MNGRRYSNQKEREELLLIARDVLNGMYSNPLFNGYSENMRSRLALAQAELLLAKLDEEGVRAD